MSESTRSMVAECILLRTARAPYLPECPRGMLCREGTSELGNCLAASGFFRGAHSRGSCALIKISTGSTPRALASLRTAQT